ncbi:MAG: hypothetical protein OEY77_00090 [Nitrospira sp.]|nr:hypothetical protein [Nitrospira sp.]
MKRLVVDDGTNVFEQLIGERLTLFCMNYIYTGKLIGVNKTWVLLTEASIVYETGELCDNTWQDAQRLPHDWRVNCAAVESFGVLK